MLEDGPEGLTAEEVELMQSVIEGLEEMEAILDFPIDPRVVALIAIASDYLSEQIENNIRYSNEEEVFKIIDEGEGEEEKEDKGGLLLSPSDDAIEAMVKFINKPIGDKLLYLVEEELPSLPGNLGPSTGDQMEADIHKWFEEGMPDRK